ncbi:MAG: hypothetical protein C4527_24565 [Candidatus Omnitrophota bacterium]|jgi:lipid-A-disaccharide synthase-like uncharacterized protein|nr:MAG: hypothetical protein C4527_24565 [Candidatus Omnitrophota bacterium]
MILGYNGKMIMLLRFFILFRWSGMKRICVLSVVFWILCSCAIASDDFLIRDGDRVVIWGDSITDNAYYP